MFDTQMAFLKDIFENIDFDINQQTTKRHAKLPVGEELGVSRVFFFHGAWKDVALLYA